MRSRQRNCEARAETAPNCSSGTQLRESSTRTLCGQSITVTTPTHKISKDGGSPRSIGVFAVPAGGTRQQSQSRVCYPGLLGCCVIGLLSIASGARLGGSRGDSSSAALVAHTNRALRPLGVLIARYANTLHFEAPSPPRSGLHTQGPAGESPREPPRRAPCVVFSRRFVQRAFGG
jgi:hypothetical protein